jgi:hypothetical protein
VYDIQVDEELVMRKIVITVEGKLSERALPADISKFGVDVWSLEDCFFDVLDAKIIDMKEAGDGAGAE